MDRLSGFRHLQSAPAQVAGKSNLNFVVFHLRSEQTVRRVQTKNHPEKNTYPAKHWANHAQKQCFGTRCPRTNGKWDNGYRQADLGAPKLPFPTCATL
jgi:hypothetical protein